MLTPQRAVTAWRAFADRCVFEDQGVRQSWRQYLSTSRGQADEERLIQPTVFPRFAEELLGYKVNINLAPEVHATEGKPDFTPADPVTHPFVFETKGTNLGLLERPDVTQILGYLVHGRPRIRDVVLTNLYGIRVFRLDESGTQLEEILKVNLGSLLELQASQAAQVPDAARLAQFLDTYGFKELTVAEKLDRVRRAPEWNPITAITDASWISARLETVVGLLLSDVDKQIEAGVIQDPARVQPSEQAEILDELRRLEWQLGTAEDVTAVRTIADYLTSTTTSPAGKALRQYSALVAYYAATRLVIVRIWEDLGLLRPVLYNGGFDHWMTAFQDSVLTVIDHSYRGARDVYRALFDQRHAHTWYTPSEGAAALAVYELANTYFGSIESDVLGSVYERLLERIDRKLLGQYYTPRDVIGLIWDLLDMDRIAQEAENDNRAVRVLDVATGSAGFLVDGVHRLIMRFNAQRASGAAIDPQTWVNRIADGFSGIEIQPFPAYLGELNLLVQLARVLSTERGVRLPPLGILAADTLSLHNPANLFDEGTAEVPTDLLFPELDRRERALRIRNPVAHDYLMDVACGNPPYVGEKHAARLLRETRRRFTYWNDFVAPHLDYQYWFLVLGISKLRQGGRFGFITTEYWLRSEGAGPLRNYIARHCRLERLILFRELRLFPDAPGQHSMIVIGERVSKPGDVGLDPADRPKALPLVSIYEGRAVSLLDRRAIVGVMREGASRTGVRTFRAPVNPNSLGGASWAEMILTQKQLDRRRKLRTVQQLDLSIVKGVETTVNALTEDSVEYMTAGNLAAVGWPQSKVGISILSPAEVVALGRLSAEEKRAVRPLVNTTDVFPYAAVLPSAAPWIIYLRKDDHNDPDLTAQQVVDTPFPLGMPHLQTHLQHFQSLLAFKTLDRHERRPWWSLHRPRAEVVDQAAVGRWASYCVTTRWGNGGRLIVGLSPAGAVPSSSLHTLSVAGVPAAYLCGLFNSSLYQDVAQELPPGQLRKDDLQKLGLPAVEVGAISTLSLGLADAVSDLVLSHGLRFPDLISRLRADITLTERCDAAWTPHVGPVTAWGELSAVRWSRAEISSHGPQSQKIASAEVTHDLFGANILAIGEGGASLTVSMRDAEETTAVALLAAVFGMARRGGVLRDIASMKVPLDGTQLAAALTADRAALATVVSHYRQLRDQIDAIVDQGLA